MISARTWTRMLCMYMRVFCWGDFGEGGGGGGDFTSEQWQ